MQSPYQVDMKNVVECQKEFFAYFNALETRGVFHWSIGKADVGTCNSLFQKLVLRQENLIFKSVNTKRLSENY